MVAAGSVVDRSLAAIGGLLTLPLLLITLTVVAIESKGSPLIRQVRLGHRKRPFELLKVRTMYALHELALSKHQLSEESLGPVQKRADDPRITPSGRFLRRWSLDELPQLWNVVLGNMTLVGPRPILPEELSLVGEKFQNRFDVLPGITGLAQLRARARLGDEHFSYDSLWVQNRSLRLYFKILLATLPAVLEGDGAY